jgi:DNA integrity scanning protein DisA with diadenylate cyclase activity
MGLAESMYSIAENIKTSHNLRVNELGKLIVDTQNTLKQSAAARKKMSTEQAKALNNFKQDLSKNVSALHKEFRNNRNNMKDQQSKRLINFKTNLINDVTSMLSSFHKEHGETAKELKTKLTNETNAIHTNVKNLLKEFNDNHNEMSAALKKSLSKFSDNLFNDVKKLIGDYNSDRMKAKAHWQKMSLDIAKARKNGNGKKLKVLAGEKAFVAESLSKNTSTKPKEKKTQKKEVEQAED